MSRRKNKKYSAELKLEAVQAYLNGEGSYEKLRKRYGLLSSTQLKEWVKWYNGHKEFKERRFGRPENSTKKTAAGIKKLAEWREV